MTRTRFGRNVVRLGLAALLLAMAPAVHAEQEGPPATAQAPEQKVQDQVDEEVAERRRAMIEEARTALDETDAALQALDEGDREQALESLARATGKLELIVARDPELALAPVDVDFVTYDVYGTPEAIRRARDDAEELLDDGRVQEARALLSGLASEIVISVTNLPLATYPDAIKEVSPLIDEGRIEEAKTALRAALGTLVVTDHVISLPVLRAQMMLERAEELVNAEEPAEDAEDEIDELVKGAREQLEMAELLGYGDEADHERFRKQIAELRKRIGADEETGGAFARLRSSLTQYQTTFFE